MKIKGQLSEQEFYSKYGNHPNGKAIIKYGKATYNYWMQHDDGSWTNYDCKTSMAALTNSKFRNG